MESTAADHVRALIQKKDAIEAEILAIVDELQNPGPNGTAPVGLRGNLVDREGFPRNDIDIMRITTLRNRHAILNTDLAQLMREIEQGLHALHAATPKPQVAAASMPVEVDQLDDPFLKVNSCHPDSPAFQSGLREGDIITRFGSLRAGEFESSGGFSKVAEQVQENRPMRVFVLRQGARKTFTLTPQKWNGQGLLGCHLIKCE